MGFDSAMRGAKLDEFRPDLIVFDDMDGRHDTEHTVAKKIDTTSTSILPFGQGFCGFHAQMDTPGGNGAVDRVDRHLHAGDVTNRRFQR